MVFIGQSQSLIQISAIIKSLKSIATPISAFSKNIKTGPAVTMTPLYNFYRYFFKGVFSDKNP
jgi:hypothetical protein